MLKVIVVDQCEYCEGESHVLVGKFIDADGKQYPKYLPCAYCNGTGEVERRVNLREFQKMLDKANSMEPDYSELSKQKPTSQYQDSRDSAGI